MRRSWRRSFQVGNAVARLERYDVTAPIIFVIAGLLLTHGPLAPLSFAPFRELVEALAEITLILALAPTDAALGAGVMVNPTVPARIRRLLNIESGLNGGIATPVVLVAIAGAATAEHAASIGPAKAAAELTLGVLTGGAGGFIVNVARRRRETRRATGALRRGDRRPGVTAGLVRIRRRRGVPAFESLTWQTVLYAGLSLTVIRMAPVALALAGTRLGHAAVAFVGWFGPRGLTSVVFALLALDDIGEPAGPAVTVIAFTILLSVIAHGLTADPLAHRYGRNSPLPQPDPTTPECSNCLRGNQSGLLLICGVSVLVPGL